MGLSDLFYRLSAIQKMLLIIGAYAIVLGLYYLFVLSSFQFEPLARDMQNVRRDIDSERERLTKAEEIKASIEQHKAALKDLVESLPEKADFDATSRQIDQIAGKVGVKILKFAPAKEETNQEYFISKIPFQLTLYGEYKKLGAFFQQLDQLPRLVHVDALSLKPRDGKTIKRLQATPLDAAVTLATYRRMSEEEIQAFSQQQKTSTAPKK